MHDNNKPERIVRGQKVTDEKHDQARRLRREMSPVERVLWRRLRSNQLLGWHFRRQQVIAGYIADFYCHSAGLAVEIDGDTHDDPDRDAARDRVLAQRRVRVIRFTNQQVLHEMDSVLEVILRELQTAP